MNKNDNVKWVRLGEYIEQCDERNTDNRYTHLPYYSSFKAACHDLSEIDVPNEDVQWIDVSAEMARLDESMFVVCAMGDSMKPKCWTKEFYEPQVDAQRIFLERHPDDLTAKELVKNECHEAELFLKYNKYYGYVWYIGQKI